MAYRILLISWLALLGLSGCRRDSEPAPGAEIPHLEVIHVLPVVSDWVVEPSGLVFHAGVLYTVCDKSDHWIFRLDLRSDEARLVPHLRIKPPQSGPMDWEGITVDDAGNFYLASETHHRIARVAPDGTAQWVSGDLRVVANQSNLLRKHNAGIEGLTLLPDGDLLAAAERESRGLIRIPPLDSGRPVVASEMETTPFAGRLAFWRIPDFSGLDVDQGRVYGLFRNAHLVVELVPDGPLFVESGKAWYYGHIENDPRWAYTEERYGQSEGLAVAGDRVFIIVDNNQSARKADGADRRPLLYICRKP
jgi:hypothetical protein